MEDKQEKPDSRTYYNDKGEKITKEWVEDGYAYSSCAIKLNYITDQRWDVLEIGLRSLLTEFNTYPGYENARLSDVQVREDITNGRLEIAFKGEKQPTQPTHNCDGE